MATPSMEDYIETIYLLKEQKGYARVSDIAEHLDVLPSSVTKMVKKLDESSYVVYEKYRGLILTEKGREFGEKLLYRHKLLEDFLHIIGADEDSIYEEVEGIEHHLKWDTIVRIGDLVEYFKADPERLNDLKKIKEKNQKH
ncbi:MULTISPECIES: transcriptional regulator MntR [Allobacillus]|uniref:Manganese transport regulator n=1 Tax=Allobacillus halotolerans TaxID=570278 RepID=A0ABS6GP79_9BACI|nr:MULTISPECIES: transcriptional regulator MntR [Allobacillus]MBU6080257.1 transcriptional regulator MntR [Allobacillus halotolerans]TSJ68460.1 transcriptional regulator MntR [Allobacillus sp. SKP2-8]